MPTNGMDNRPRVAFGVMVIALAALTCAGRTNAPIVHEGPTIDVALCTRSVGARYYAFGSLLFEVVGIQGQACVIRFTEEVENPNSDRSMRIECRVPPDVVNVIVKSGREAPAFASIDAYCDPL